MICEQTEMWNGLECPSRTSGEDNSLPARFERFDSANPQVYTELVSLARSIRSKRPGAIIGIGMLYEVLRWNCYMEVDSEEPYRLSNDFRAFYARKIMREEPDLGGIFQIKKSIADDTTEEGVQ
jgi:hypothetical protein